MNIIVAIDKFKGSLSAKRAAKVIKAVLNKDHKVVLCPLADGGEGSLQVIDEYEKGIWQTIELYDPLFRKIKASYFLSGTRAYIEMAAASGLGLLSSKERNPLKTSTFGTGELIKDAINNGAKDIYMFIGGSATNDAGIGMAAALGYIFLDEKNKELLPIGQNLIKIRNITKPAGSLLENINFTVLVDVNNPFYGKNGASQVYAEQKGASKNDIKELENGFIHFAGLVNTIFKKDISQIPGAGAAGGLGAGALLFLNASMQSGINAIMHIAQLKEKLATADLIITGEGKIDKQTLSGKLIKGVCNLAKENNIPVYAVCGVSELSKEEQESLGLKKIISLVDDQTPVEYAIKNAEKLLAKRVKQLFE